MRCSFHSFSAPCTAPWAGMPTPPAPPPHPRDLGKAWEVGEPRTTCLELLRMFPCSGSLFLSGSSLPIAWLSAGPIRRSSRAEGFYFRPLKSSVIILWSDLPIGRSDSSRLVLQQICTVSDNLPPATCLQGLAKVKSLSWAAEDQAIDLSSALPLRSRTSPPPTPPPLHYHHHPNQFCHQFSQGHPVPMEGQKSEKTNLI